MGSDAHKPLQGLRVLDLSRVLAGPFATQMLGDLGAEVHKIEHPERGDDTRRWGPPFVPTDDGKPGNAAYFYCANRGKTFEGIDFKTPDGQRRIRSLIGEYDVLVENYKVGDLASCDLDYNAVKSLNPRLIYCSITGFGQTGPYRHRPGYDFIIQGMSGLMSLTGAPDEAPMRCGVAIADLSASLHAVSGILSALYQRERTGKGAHVDISLLDTQVSMLSHHASQYLNGGDMPARIGNAHPNIVPYQVFSTQDQPIIIAVGNDDQFARLCEVIHLPELPVDSRFSTNAARVTHREVLIEQLQRQLVKRTSAQWLEALLAHGVPAGPVNSIDQVFEDAQVKARELEVRFDSPGTSGVRGVTGPIRIRR